MKKFTCPYCYGEHTIRDCRMKCSFDKPFSGERYTCKEDIEKAKRAKEAAEEAERAKETAQEAKKIKKAEEAEKEAKKTKKIDGLIPQDSKVTCLKCQEARKQIFCPNYDYEEEEIPPTFLSETSLSIALVGAMGSGKSNYIGVLIDEIRRKMTSRFNCTLDICCSEKSKKYYDDYYYKPLFKKNTIIRKTIQGNKIPPMIFPLRFMDKKDRIKNITALTFYDTAGENLDTVESMELFSGYIPNAKGIILLLDPLQIPSIRKQLPEEILPEENTDVVEILSRITQNIRKMKNIQGKIKIPLALVFTKIDVLEQFNILSPDSCLREESEHLKQGGFVLSDYEHTNIEMKNLLENWLDEEVIQMIKQFYKYSIFGLSSLGGIPHGDKLSDKPNPRRVLDPLLWLLAENKYIKTIGRR